MSSAGKGKVRVSVSLSREVFERIRGISRELGLKPSQWIAMAITTSAKNIKVTIEKSQDFKKGGKTDNTPTLPIKFSELLDFIQRRNKAGSKPSHKDVCTGLEITRNTARKRIRYLKGRGLILETKMGRRKILELSEKGKAINWVQN